MQSLALLVHASRWDPSTEVSIPTLVGACSNPDNFSSFLEKGFNPYLIEWVCVCDCSECNMESKANKVVK